MRCLRAKVKLYEANTSARGPGISSSIATDRSYSLVARENIKIARDRASLGLNRIIYVK